MSAPPSETLAALDWSIRAARDDAAEWLRQGDEIGHSLTTKYADALQALRDGLAKGPPASLCIDGEYRCLMCDDDAALNALPHGAPLYALGLK